MPTWQATLNPTEIGELADLILESLKNVDQYKFASKPTSNVFASDDQTVKKALISAG